MTEFTSEEDRVLRLLKKEWDRTGPPGILDLPDIVSALDQAPSRSLEAVRELFRKGLVDMNQLETSAFLTPEGYIAAQQIG